MRVPKPLGVAVLATWVASTSCTTLRELPRADYAAVPSRKAVHVETREGLVYDFDSATFDPDSLTGYRTLSDLEGAVDEVAVVHVALDDISRMRTRTVDWYRTGLVGGGVLAGVVAIGLARAARSSGDSGGSEPCRNCSPPAGARH